MIDEKKIEEAACRFAFNHGDTYGRYSRDNVVAAFKEGVNWFLNNLRHDASEEPEKNKHILLVYDNQNPSDKNIIPYGYECLNKNITKDYWKFIVKIEHITRWLYIEDLMKGGK